jgi:hypothetical protein
LEPKVPHTAAIQGSGGGKMRKTVSVSPNSSSPSAAGPEEAERYPVVPKSYGYGWGKMASNLHPHYQQKWVKHFPFVRKGGKVTVARKSQIESQVIEK